MNKTEVPKKNNKFIEKLKKSKKLQYLTVGIIILLVLFVFLFYNFSSKSETYETDAVSVYISSLETKLEQTLKNVEGVGKVSVVISVESGMETVIAKKTTVSETSNGKETVETPILVNGKTVVLKELYPKITGVLIVCEGAKNITVLNKIQQATVSLLNINLNQIEILAMK